jgi:hypothetical protein
MRDLNALIGTDSDCYCDSCYKHHNYNNNNNYNKYWDERNDVLNKENNLNNKENNYFKLIILGTMVGAGLYLGYKFIRLRNKKNKDSS